MTTLFEHAAGRTAAARGTRSATGVDTVLCPVSDIWFNRRHRLDDQESHHPADPPDKTVHSPSEGTAVVS